MVEGNRKLVVSLFLLLAVVGACWLFGIRFKSGTPLVVGSKENVILVSPEGKLVNVVAKIDTGADFSSIDAGLAQELHLPVRPGKQKTVMTAVGPEKRDTVEVTFVLGNRTISTFATVANRSDLSTQFLIGRRNLRKVRVDPRKQFMAPPGAVKLPPATLIVLQDLFESYGNEVLFIFPILGAAIVLLRLVVGLKTYGLFAPVVIAFSLLNQNVFQGVLLYLLLVSVGIAFKTLFLNRFKLPQITEMSLLMFLLVTLTFGVIAFSSRLDLSVTDIFFPLIITSLLIEHVSKTMEEHRVADAILLLLSTVLVASALAGSGKLLLRLETSWLSMIFVSTILAVIAASYYQGLRLTEILRFKVFRQKP